MASGSKRRGWAVAVLLLGTSALLVLGLTLPTLHMERAVTSETHSVLGGILSLLRGGRVFLGLVILSFSVLFPLVKLAALALIWTRRVEDEGETIVWIGILGKWSMLDVFVVAIFVAAVRLGILTEFEAEPGIYVFAAAILAMMVSAHGIERLVRRPRHVPPARPEPKLHAGWARARSAASLACFVAGVTLPLIEVEKWRFWSSESSLLGAVRTLLAEGQTPLAVLLVVFVVVLPALHFVGIVCVRWMRGLSGSALRVLLFLEEWAMLDVFALALLVVLGQLAGLASATPRAGLWFLLAAAALSAFDAWRLRASLRAGRPGSGKR